ncbi:MAG: exopolysaccharide biosynthesis polyprenyl glycosylphosphotransferase [Alphaproteobacteria bacterium]|nr:exopolysaccharide biosynthesis polyprenyl glycosylphosphotransferase [Alphaproteobacteria bacterium]
MQDHSPQNPRFALKELRLWAPSRATQGAKAKRVLDIAVSLALIVLLSPVLALISLAVALESQGPVLFCQHRTGQNGRIFAMLKFRSMRVTEDDAAVVQAKENDPRITRIGRILRTTSLDELPQLFNVLWGEMSLVGPRPHAVAHDDYYAARIAAYTTRQKVKPGMTGWAQVNGARGETPELRHMQARVALDLWYIAHRSFLLDLKILAKTPLEVLKRRNAR